MQDSGKIDPESVKAVIRKTCEIAILNQKAVESLMEAQEHTPARGVSTGKFKTKKRQRES